MEQEEIEEFEQEGEGEVVELGEEMPEEPTKDEEKPATKTENPFKDVGETRKEDVEVVTKSEVDAQVEALNKERDAVPKPWKGVNATKRRELKKKIDELTKKEVKIEKMIVDNTDPDELEEQKTRYSNLAVNVGYKNKNIAKLSNQKFADEKQKILMFADHYFTAIAASIYSIAILTGTFVDRFECLNGIAGDLKAKEAVMTPMIKQILIDDSMNSIPELKHLGNPYIRLGIAFGGIGVNRYAVNRMNKRQSTPVVEKKVPIESPSQPSQSVSQTPSNSIYVSNE